MGITLELSAASELAEWNEGLHSGDLREKVGKRNQIET